MKKRHTTPKGILWGILLFYIALISFFASRHEFWSDEWHVWFMCKNLSPKGLLLSMAREGHFCLWHLLIYPFAKAGCGFWSLELVSCSLSAIAAWLILFKAPFRIIFRLILLLSYPMLYAFPVLPRCYALIPPILFATATLYRNLPNRKYLYCFCVGLLAHTHSYMEGVVAMLFLLFIYEHIYLLYKNKNIAWKTNCKPALLTIAIVICAAVQVLGSRNYINPSFRDTNVELVGRFYENYALHLVDSLSEMTIFTIPNIDLPLSFLFWAAIFVSLYKCFWEKKQDRRLALVGFFSISFMTIFGTTIFMMVLQRLLLPFFVLVLLLWFNKRKEIEKYSYAALVSLCALVSCSQYSNIYADITRIYCNGEKVSNFIHETVPHGSILAMNNHFYYINELLEDDYKRGLLDVKDNHYTDEIIDEFIKKYPCETFYAISKKRDLSYSGTKYKMKCLYDGRKDNAINIWHSVYQIDRID